MWIHSLYTRLFSKPWVSALIILLAWINKCWISYVHGSLAGDKSIYAMMTSNALRGNGFTETFFFLEHPGQAFYFTNSAIYSPGYSFLLAIPLWLTNNLFQSTFIIDAAAWLLLITGIRALMKQSGIATYTINLATLFTGFFIYPHEGASVPKDTLALAFICWALFLMIRSINKSNPVLKDGLLPGLFFLLPGIIKITWLPLSLVFLLILLFLAFYKKEKRLLRVFYGACISVFILGLLLYGWINSNQPNIPSEYLPAVTRSWQMIIAPQELGFNPSSAGLIYPFIPAAFVNMDIAGTIFVHYLNFTEATTHNIFLVINYSLLILLIAFFIRFLVKHYKRNLPKEADFLISGSTIAFGVFIILFSVAILFSPVSFKGSGGIPYIYARESRPFIFIMLFLQMVFFIRLWNKPQGTLTVFCKTTRLFLFGLFLLHVVHGFVYSAKKVVAEINRTVINNEHSLLSEIDTIKKANPGKKITLITEIAHLRWLLLLKNEMLYTDAESLATKEIPLAANELRICILFKEDLPVFKEYMGRKDVRTLYESPQYIILGQGLGD